MPKWLSVSYMETPSNDGFDSDLGGLQFEKKCSMCLIMV
jgi:hypothetical protein